MADDIPEIKASPSDEGQSLLGELSAVVDATATSSSVGPKDAPMIFPNLSADTDDGEDDKRITIGAMYLVESNARPTGDATPDQSVELSITGDVSISDTTTSKAGGASTAGGGPSIASKADISTTGGPSVASKVGEASATGAGGGSMNGGESQPFDVEEGALKKEKNADRHRPSHITSCLVKGESRGTNVVWANLDLNLENKKGEIVKPILRNVWGEALTGETTAIMGASGAGKTSLLNVVSGRVTASSPLKMHGELRFGDVHADETNLNAIRQSMAFVAQQDTMNELSTPREAIRFSARLRLPSSTPDEEIDSLVDSFIDRLGLTKSADTVIGGVLKKGISGGEKKRTSVGMELVTNPAVILLDEPTSGLDSFAAQQLVTLLRNIAHAGNTVIFTMHQPSSKIFFGCDKLILLNHGRVMHAGPTKEIQAAFAERGYPIEALTNPADWILEVAQDYPEEELEAAGFFPKDPRTLGAVVGTVGVPERSFGIYKQTIMLVQREWANFKRFPLPSLANFIITGIMSTFCGVLFLHIGAGDRLDSTITQGIVGSLVTILLLSMMGQASPQLVLFANERPLFLREYSTNTYSILPYVISKLTKECIETFIAILLQTVITYFLIEFRQNFGLMYAINVLISFNATSIASLIGASVSDPTLASSLFPLVIVPQFYFSGVLVAVSLIPTWLRWMQWLCALRYAAALSFFYEFDKCTASEQVACDAVLSAQGVSSGDLYWFWIVFISLAVVFKVGAILVLQRNSVQFY